MRAVGLGIEDLYRLIEEARPPWWNRAKCLAAGPTFFFADQGGQAYEEARRAKAVCNGDDDEHHVICPVRKECLWGALVRNEKFGVWGGMSPREIRAVRREYVALGLLEDDEPTEEAV